MRRGFLHLRGVARHGGGGGAAEPEQPGCLGAGAAFTPAQSGWTTPVETTHAPWASLTGLPELSVTFGVTLANAKPEAIASTQPSVSVPSEEIFMSGTPKR